MLLELRARLRYDGTPDETHLRDPDWRTIIALGYQAILGRAPSAEELASWPVSTTLSDPISHLINSIQQSSEAQVRQEQPIATLTLDFTETRALIAVLYIRWLGRDARADEIDFWAGVLSRNGRSISWLSDQFEHSEEAISFRLSSAVLPDLPDGEFVTSLFKIVLGWPPVATEVEHYDRMLRGKLTNRGGLLREFFARRVENDRVRDPVRIPPDQIPLLGSTTIISKSDSYRRNDDQSHVDSKDRPTRFPYIRRQGSRVGILTSMYRGGAFVKEFIENMISQTIFDECELIIVDAASPDRELDQVNDYVVSHRNIRWVRLEDRISVYDAWNQAIQLTTAPYLTNCNLDDVRRKDSIELQASVLDGLPFVDVVYQDFYHSFEPCLDFEEIERMNLKTELPVVTRNNLMLFNAPHNAPMWRRELHDELGLFDASFLTAGDYDFWVRCAVARKMFYKINDPHVGYYVNPNGLSTKENSAALAETRRIHLDKGEQLISSWLRGPIGDFHRACGLADGHGQGGESRYDIVQSALLGLEVIPTAHGPVT